MLGDFTGFIEAIISILTKKYQLMVVSTLGIGGLLVYLLWDSKPFDNVLYDNLLVGGVALLTMLLTFVFSHKAKAEEERNQQQLTTNQAIEKAGEIIRGWASQPLPDDFVGTMVVSTEVSIVIKDLKKGRYAFLKVNGIVQKERILIKKSNTA